MHFRKIKRGVISAALWGALLPAWASPAAADFLIENVTLLDGTGGAAMAGAHVLVKSNRIATVSPVSLRHDAGVEVIDGNGKFLIPGLIDSHIHIQKNGVVQNGKTVWDRHFGMIALHSYLYSGFTTVFDAANDPDWVFSLRADEQAGKIVSPRIFATGSPITVPGGYGDEIVPGGGPPLRVGDWSMARPELDAYFKQRKPDVQKVLIDRHGVFTPLNPSPSVETLRNIVKLANENGIRTTVHAASEDDFNDALDGGIDNFAHVIRYPSSDGMIKRLATKRVALSTTLAVFQYIERIATDTAFLDEPIFKAVVDPAILDRQKTTERQRYISSGMSAQFRAMHDAVPVNTKKIFDAGGVLTLGTDRAWGATSHMEMDLLHKAGIPLQALVRIATLNGAVYLGKEKDLGSIERGKIADMVLLNADPTQDVKNYQAIAAVFKDGKRVDRAKLDVPANRK